MNKQIIKREKKARRHARSRTRIHGTLDLPRISVFRSNSHIYAQIVDDQAARTLVAVSSKDAKADNKVSAAEQVGKALAEKAVSLKIQKVIFDRSGYKYHGRVKALAEAARAAGLQF